MWSVCVAAFVALHTPSGSSSKPPNYAVTVANPSANWNTPKAAATDPNRPTQIKAPKPKIKPSSPSAADAHLQPKPERKRIPLHAAIHRMKELAPHASLEDVDAVVAPIAEDARSINSLISEIRKRGDWQKALYVAESLETRANRGDTHVAPNQMLYNAILAVLADTGRSVEAAALLERMRQRGFELRSRTYALAVRATSSITEALTLVHDYEAVAAARSPGGVADEDDAAFVFSAGMRACVRGGAWGEALLVYERMRSNGVQTDAHCTAAMLEACRAGRQWERARDELARVQPHLLTGFHYSIAMGTCLRCVQWQEALTLFDNYAASLGDSDAPDEYCFAAALAACRQGAQGARAVEMLDRAVAAGHTLVPHMLEHATAACAAAGDHHSALACHKRADNPTDASLLLALEAIAAIARDADGSAITAAAAADEVIRRARRHGGAVSDGATEALVLALDAAGSHARVLEEFDAAPASVQARESALVCAHRAADRLGDKPKKAVLSVRLEMVRSESAE